MADTSSGLELPVSASGRSAEDVARGLAREASRIMLERFGRGGHRKTVKGRGNYVTETDLAVEHATLKTLRREYPGHAVLSEETSQEVERWDRGWLWVVDPLDGTANFARGIPTFVFNLALCHDGEPVLGLTHQPVTGDEFFAVKGGGLWANGERTLVSDAATLSESLVGIGLGYEYDRAKLMLGLLADLWPGVQTVQNIGSAALGLAYAASGRFDLYVHSFLYPWDLAAGVVQVREGGGLFLDRAGNPATLYSEGVVAGAPGPVREFVAATVDRPWR